MEKFGLFDLIDKFNSASVGKNDFSETRAEPKKGQEKCAPESALKDPDFGAPPQYLMSVKMAAYIKRHDELAAQVKKKRTNRGRKPKSVQKGM